MTEYPPLFPPGFHEVQLDALRATFVEPFDPPDQRARLLEGLFRFVNELRDVADGVTWEVWLDGSFSTEKLHPSDIDILVVGTRESHS